MRLAISVIAFISSVDPALTTRSAVFFSFFEGLQRILDLGAQIRF